METLGTALIVLGILGFLVSLVAIVVALVRKKKKKLWLVSFLVFLVLAIVGGAISPTTEPGRQIEKPASTVKSEEPVKKKVKEEVLEIRVCPRDGINIRTGPGIDYGKDEDGPLVKSEKLYVLEEKAGWIRARISSEKSTWEGWVKKDLTVSKGQWEAIKVQEEKKKIQIKAQEEKKKIHEWFDVILGSVDGYEKISLSGDRKTLTITVSDKWYYTPDFQKERIMEQTGKQFAVFAARMGWRGKEPDVGNYPTVIFVDIAGKEVGKHSTWGTKVYG